MILDAPGSRPKIDGLRTENNFLCVVEARDATREAKRNTLSQNISRLSPPLGFIAEVTRLGHMMMLTCHVSHRSGLTTNSNAEDSLDFIPINARLVDVESSCAVLLVHSSLAGNR